MGQVLFFFGYVAILVLFLVKEYETVQVSPCQVECKNATCPANCNCTKSRVSCHDRNLTYIPRIPCGITHLNLSSSNINTLSINETSNLSCSFETLTHMSLRDCKITLFVGDVFTNLTKLEVLDLSFNKIVSNQRENLQSIQRAIGSLNRAPLRKLKLDRFFLQNGVQEIFTYFEGRHLTHLSMCENKMQEFEDNVLENFTKLVHLDLHGNWINKINLSSGIPTLELFNLSHNQINIFPPIFCDHNTGETHYNNLKNLDLSWNQIIVPYSQNWNCLKTLETLNLSRNDMEDITNNNSFTGLTSLITLILSEMRFSLKRIRKEALKSDSLQRLDLSGNGLNFENHKEVDENIFHYLPNLTSLDVSDNDFGSDGYKKLTKLSRLETLIMRNVYLRLLPDDFLGHFPNLRYLDLYRNKIEQFSAEAFQNVRNLEYLNISDNLISNFPVPPLPPATLKSLETFDFAYNYFICDCEIVKLRKWINDVLSDPNKTNLISRYPDQYWCYKPQPLYKILLKDAKPTHCKNTKYQLVLSVICSVSICVVFTVFLVVGYIYRWEIKLFLHQMHRQKRYDRYHPLTYTFEYNSYVAYAEKDSAWVIHDLLKDLEEAKYKVYTRDRDSVPGVARCDEIVDNIYKSKTVIFVLSKNFTACQWCTYQLNVAQARAVKLGPHFMIPVLLEGIDTKHMKKSVQHLFRTSKPIEWARQSTKNRLFWSELKTALDAELNDDFEETGYQSLDAEYSSIST
uniref:Toll6 n=1 Tax=Sinohyriopsis cumingii TaxID=165450 RepID=A0A5B7QCA4_SINCU|nr:Toll6 [Sinohyriopsis cumingii]